jgi:hypothetical protein
MVYKERKSLTVVALEGVDVDNILGSLVKLAEVLWIENALKKLTRGMHRFIQAICNRTTISRY